MYTLIITLLFWMGVPVPEACNVEVDDDLVCAQARRSADDGEEEESSEAPAHAMTVDRRRARAIDISNGF